jgi:uncharacterized DUF497 family protein
VCEASGRGRHRGRYVACLICTFVHTVCLVGDYQWDAKKAEDNQRKHGVDFADAVYVLEDELAVTIEVQHHRGEERFATLGMDPLGRVLVVVYTWRGEEIRLISARKATPAERAQYEEKP